MRKSTRLLGIVLLTLLALGILGILGTRIVLGRIIPKDESLALEPGGQRVTREYDMKDYDSLEIYGIWDVDVTRGREYGLSIKGPENHLDALKIKTSGSTLILDNTGFRKFGDRGFKARITIPALKAVDIKGSAALDFTGFRDEELTLVLSGAGQIEGRDSSYNRINIICAGAGHVDLSDCPAGDAEVNLSGAGHIELRMAGGVLSGKLSGLGSVEYSGRVSRETIQVSGLGSVDPQ